MSTTTPSGPKSWPGHLLRGLSWPSAAIVVQRRSRLVFLLALGTGLLVSAAYGHHTVGDLPFAVVDDDHTNLTRTIDLSLDATRELTAVRTYGDFAAATAAVSRGELIGAVYLPEGLTAAIKRGRAARVPLAVDGSNILISKTAQRAAETTLATISAGVEVTIARKGGYSAEESLGRAAPIGLDVVRPWNPHGSYAVYLVPAVLLFNLHLFCLTFATFLLAPKPVGPITHPLARGAALVGALLPAGLLLAGLTLAALPWLGLSVHGDPMAAAAFAMAFAAVSLLEAAALRAVVPSPAFATQLTAVLGALSLMLSGATFTIDLFPAPLRTVAEALPLTPAVDALRGVVAAPHVAAIDAAAWQALATQAASFGGAIAIGLLIRGLVRAARRVALRRHQPVGAA